MKKLKRFLPFIIVFISTSGAGIFSYLLYADVYLRQDILDGREVAGEVQEVENTVKRKLSDRFVFDSVETDDRVYWNDTIQTSAGSKVKVTLNDGTKISLGESALVVLEKESGGLSLKLKSGNLVIEGESGEKAVKVNGVKVEQDANKSIALSVDVKSGVLTASKIADDGATEKIDIEALKRAEEQKRAQQEREKEEFEKNQKMPTPNLLAPTNNSKIDFSSKLPLWSWENVDRAVEYRFMVRTASKLKPKLVYEKVVKSNKIQIDHDLDDGSYLWSVFAVDRFGNESPAAELKFEVMHSDALDAPEVETSEVQ